MSNKATSLSLLERLGESTPDETAWDEFQATYIPLIRKWLMRQGVEANDAEDIQQDVLQKAVTELGAFRHNGRTGALRRWLRLVMVNQLKAHYRRGNRNGRAVGGSDYTALANQLEDPASRLSRQWEIEYHTAACDRLLARVSTDFSPQTILAFRQVAIEDRTTAEVAEDLGISPNAVRIAQSRVMRRLRELNADRNLDSIVSPTTDPS